MNLIKEMPHGIIKKLYDAANIMRWNDHIRPVELSELDKQAHKIIIAYIVAKFEETYRNADIDWIKLIEGSIFEFLHRVVLTDIKPPVFHKMMKEKGRELNQWVIKTLENNLKDVNQKFYKNFTLYWNDRDYSKNEKRILSAAHFFATMWEFNIIYSCSKFIYGIDETKKEIESKIEDYYDLIGVQKISLKKKSYGFIDLCGQLRFQIRWIQLPRIPKTSVLGHMFIVAVMSYLLTEKVIEKCCEKRKYNNFFGGLFHDLPEVLTRDIISPIKRAVEGLDEIIKEFEKTQLEDKLLPLLPEEWHEELKYFVTDEFSNKIIDQKGKIKRLKNLMELNNYNKDEYNPIDGRLIKFCDLYSAFMEAEESINLGIKPEQLQKARDELQEILEGYEI